MGSYRKYTAKVKTCKGGIIALEHEDKMQVRPINENGYVIEIKTKNDKVKLLQSEVKDMMEYFLRVAF
jgi:NMD protein affecting ribosome stability and mRNA decay